LNNTERLREKNLKRGFRAVVAHGFLTGYPWVQEPGFVPGGPGGKIFNYPFFGIPGRRRKGILGRG